MTLALTLWSAVLCVCMVLPLVLTDPAHIALAKTTGWTSAIAIGAILVGSSLYKKLENKLQALEKPEADVPRHVYGMTENFPLATVYPLFLHAVAAECSDMADSDHDKLIRMGTFMLPVCITQDELQALQKNGDTDVALRLSDRIRTLIYGIRQQYPACTIVPCEGRLAVTLFTPDVKNIPWKPLNLWFNQ